MAGWLFGVAPLFVVWFTSAAIVGYVPDYMGKGRIIMSCTVARKVITYHHI